MGKKKKSTTPWVCNWLTLATRCLSAHLMSNTSTDCLPAVIRALSAQTQLHNSRTAFCCPAWKTHVFPSPKLYLIRFWSKAPIIYSILVQTIYILLLQYFASQYERDLHKDRHVAHSLFACCHGIQHWDVHTDVPVQTQPCCNHKLVLILWLAHNSNTSLAVLSNKDSLHHSTLKAFRF